MSDTTVGDTSSSSSSPRETSAPSLQAETRHQSHQPHTFELPNLPAPHESTASNDSIPFRAQKNHKHATWARTFHSRPELLIKPQSITELQKVAILARKYRRRLVTVGSGHSPSDLTCTSSWMLNLDGLAKVLDVQVYDKPSNASTSKPPEPEAETAWRDGGFGLTPAESQSQPQSRSDPKQTPPRYGGRALVQAGISLENLNIAMKAYGLTLPNLGSIHIQSLAGAIATATHGSSMRHGIMSSSVRGLRIMLASGELRWCSLKRGQDPDLFRAALVSLGALGVITEIEIELAPSSNIQWESAIWGLDDVMQRWNTDLWSQAEFVRCWWMPYTRRMVVWKAEKTAKPDTGLRVTPGGRLGFHAYQCALWVSNWIPRLTPCVEWLFMGLAHGFGTGSVSSGVEEQRTGLLMDCMYSQFVNEWAIPFRRGPEAITRLDHWLRGPADPSQSGIPFSNKGLYAHAPIEVRVGNTGASERAASQPFREGVVAEGDLGGDSRAFLDPTCEDEPTLYLNATLYRPYGSDPPWKDRYYEAFEWTMKALGGRPHWAKNFSTVTRQDFEGMYGEGLQKWRAVRREVDPDGLFCGDWHRRLVLEEELGHGVEHGSNQLEKDSDLNRMDCEEEQVSRKHLWAGGVMWSGRRAQTPSDEAKKKEDESMREMMRHVR